MLFRPEEKTGSIGKVSSREKGLAQSGGGSGLTLVEVLIALLLTGIILAAVYNLFGSQENTQVIVEQLSEMNQNLRIAANSIFMDMRQAGFHVEQGLASSGQNPCEESEPHPIPAICVKDGGTDRPDEVIVLYAVPGFETRLTSEYSSPGTQASIEDGCPPVAGSTVRTCSESSPTCFCRGDLVIMTGGGFSSVFQVTSDASDGPIQLDLGSSSPYNSDGHLERGFPSGGYGIGSRVSRAILRIYRVSLDTEPPSLLVEDGSGVVQTLVEGIEDLQILPADPNCSTDENCPIYEVAITARTRKEVPVSGYRRRTITEMVKVRNLD